MIQKVNGREVKFSAFTVNESIFFALKKISGDSENEIISYFYELGMQLFNDSISKRRIPNLCQRIVKVFYKDTELQVKFEVYARIRPWSNSNTTDPISLTMDLTCPNIKKTLSGNAINDMFSEVGLGLGDTQVIDIKKPEEKLYKCLRSK
jgi:hypothetical protein